MPRSDSPFLQNTPQNEEAQSPSGDFRIYYNRDRWKKQWLRGFLRRFDAIFTNIIPIEDVKDMPARYKYGIGSLALLGIGGIFLALFITSYERQLRQLYLAPLKENDITSSSDCNTISTSNSGQFLATLDGHWEGSANFTYSQAVYSIYLTNWNVDIAEYTSILNKLYNGVLVPTVGGRMVNNNLGQNILYWTSFAELADPNNQAQRFTATGDPVAVFNREHIVGHLSSQQGVCNASIFTRFLAAESNVYIQTPYDSYVNNEICNRTVNPHYLGYVDGVNTNTFEVKIDIRALFTAAAVNLGILNFDNIVAVESSRENLPIDGILYSYAYYYDPKFPGMKPIYCVSAGDNQLCTLRVGKVFTFPFFHHLGNNTQLPEKCICADLTAEELSYRDNPCNVFNFIAGLMFWQTELPDPLFEMISKYNYSFDTLNSLSFPAAFVSSYWGQKSLNKTYLNSPQYLHDAFSFCNISYGTCSLLTFSAFDSSGNDWTVSKYYYQLENGACNASLTASPANWQKLIETPFSDLIQKYQNCSYSTEYAFFTQFGASIGNLSAATPIYILIFLALLAVLQSVCRFRIPTIAYHKNEKDAAIEAFAVALLRERDRQLYGIGKDDDRLKSSLTRRLVEELMKDGASYKLTGVERVQEDNCLSPLQHWQELAELKSSASLILLNKSTTNSLRLDGCEPIDNFLQWWQIATESDKVEVLTNFRNIVHDVYADRFGLERKSSHIPTNSAIADSQYWSVVRDSGVFTNISWTETISSSCNVAILIGEIALYHTCLQTNTSNISRCTQLYGHKIGYRFADGDHSIGEMQVLVGKNEIA